MCLYGSPKLFWGIFIIEKYCGVLSQPQIITIDFSKRKRVKNIWIDIQYMIEYIMKQ